MPRNGAGLYTRPAGSWNPLVNGQIAEAPDGNTTLSDYDTAISESIARDGQTTTTGKINFAQGVAISAGTQALPSLSFTTDATTGLYLEAVGLLGFTVSGTRQLLLTTSSLRPFTAGTMSLGSTTFPYADIYSNMFFAQVLGSALAPSYTFNGDTDTGFYNSAIDTIGISTNGTARFNIGNSGIIPSVANSYDIGSSAFPFNAVYPNVIYAQPGSAANPRYTFSTDTDTGLYSAGVNSIGFTAGATGRFTMSTTSFSPVANGAYTLGTNSLMFSDTYSQMFFAENNTSATPSYTFTNDTDTGIYRSAIDTIGVTTGGIGRFTISSTALAPTATANYDLGAGGLLFNNVYATTLRMQSGSAAAPSYSFSGDASQGFYRENSNAIAISIGGVSRARWIISPTNAYIPTADNATSLGQSGNRWTAVWAVNGTIQTSDERAKQAIEDIPAQSALDFVRAVRPKKFRWRENDDGREHHGFTAQDLLQIEPDAGYIYTSEEGEAGINYAELIPRLFSALQVLADRVEALESERGNGP